MENVSLFTLAWDGYKAILEKAEKSRVAPNAPEIKSALADWARAIEITGSFSSVRERAEELRAIACKLRGKNSQKFRILLKRVEELIRTME
ncbi:MAG: hypothetical protein HYV32_01050 [Candidatus Kerfeldbacteria bacterium]|nr:hypothetical protein [Candidatus Kerfeldbacteria bacterium]